MKKLPIFLLLVSMMVLTGCTASNTTSSSTSTSGATNSREVNLDVYQLKTTYLNDNQWQYEVIGQMPTPCHEFTTEVIVAESFPEQVSIIIKEPSITGDDVCAQVITEKKQSGTFSASEGATVSLSK